MATITAITSSVQREYLNVLDPNTWVGGVVPGPNDTAVFPHTLTTNYRNTGDTNPSNEYYIHPILAPWSGSSITKAGTTKNVTIDLFNASSIHLRDNGGANSGSVYCRLYGYNNWQNSIKIDYEYRSGNRLYSCSFDETYRRWADTRDIGWNENDYPAIGRLYYNNATFVRNQNQYELTGSGEWKVGHIDMGNHTDFRVKDDAKVVLTSTTPRIDLTYATQQTVQFLDQATLEISGSDTTTSNRDGIDAYRESNVAIIISGSPNYSSSFVSTPALAGSTELQVDDGTAFQEGDIISIESTASFSHHVAVNTPSQNYSYNYQAYRSYVTASSGTDRFFPTSSYSNVSLDAEMGVAEDYATLSNFNGDIIQDELVRVITSSGDTLTVGKFFTRRGTVEHMMGTYNYKEFVETFNQTADFYSGRYRAILVDSVHRNYKKGDTLIINKKVYNVQATGTYLTQSLFADFANGADPRDYFVWSENEISGSGYTTAQSGYSNANYNWDEIYRKGTLWASGSIKGDTCFFLNSASLKSYTRPGTQYDTYLYHNVMLTGSYFDQGEIEVSASINNTQINDLDVTSGVGINWPSSPFTRVSSYSGDTQGRLATTNTVDQAPMQFGIEPYYGMYLRAADSVEYGQVLPFRNYTGSKDSTFNHVQISNFDIKQQQYTDAAPIFYASASGESFSIKFKRTGNHNQYYYRDKGGETEVFSSYTDSEKSAVKIGIQHWAKVYSISVKERYQLLLLDTQDTFERLDEIQDGGLINNQSVNKPVKWVATEVEDALGYKNILWDWYDKKGKTSIIPYRQGFTRTNAAYDAGYIRERYSSQYTFEQQSSAAQYYFGYDWNNDATSTCIDFGHPITFDRIAIGCVGSAQYYEGTRDTTQYGANNQITNFGIDYSTDNTTNESSFASWRAVSNDDRRSTGLTGLRFYTGSAITTQVIKLTGGRGTRIGPYKFFIGAYSGSSSPDIKLKNVNNFKVGDYIMFWSQQKPNGNNFMSAPYQTYQSAIYPSFITNYNTGDYETDVEPTTNGGFRNWYEIKAINGNTVTLDRDPVYQHLDKGTLVYKVNRGNVTFKVNHLGRNYGGCNIYSDYPTSYHKIQNAWIQGTVDIRQSTTYYPIFAQVENVVATPPWTRRAHFGYFNDCTNILARNNVGFGFLSGLKRNGIIRSDSNFYNNLLMGGGDGLQYQYRSQSPSGANFNFCFSLNGESYGFPYYESRLYGNYGSPSLRPQKQHNIYQEYQYNYHGAFNLAQQGSGGRYGVKHLDSYSNIYGNWYYGARIGSTSAGRSNINVTSKSYSTLYQSHKAHHNSGLYHIHPRPMLRYYGQYGYGDSYIASNLGVLILEHPFYSRKNIIYINEGLFRTSTHSTLIIEESKGHYSFQKLGSFNPQAYQESFQRAFKRCSFVTSKDIEVRIQFQMDYKWHRGSLLSFGEYQQLTSTAYPIANYSVGYTRNNSIVPYLVLLEFSNDYPAGKTIDIHALNSDCENFTTVNYSKTFNISKDSQYEFCLFTEDGYKYAAPYTVGEYKTPTFNIVSEEADKISVVHSTFNVERMFNNSNETTTLIEGTESQGPESVVKLTNDITSTVKFNKIKL